VQLALRNYLLSVENTGLADLISIQALTTTKEGLSRQPNPQTSSHRIASPARRRCQYRHHTAAIVVRMFSSILEARERGFLVAGNPARLVRVIFSVLDKA
jgi:hypothetical protein